MAIFEFFKEDGPPLAMTSDTTLPFKRGKWRHIRPFYQEKAAPCREGCPAGEDIARYMGLIRQGKLAEAFLAIMEDNPLPGVCGRVCHHPCEEACNRKEFDQGLAVKGMERFLADRESNGRVPLARPAKKREKVAVVGSGPAGLSAAYFLARLGYEVTIFEASSLAGGLLVSGIPAYRLPRHVVEKEVEAILSLGISLKVDHQLGRDLFWEELKLFQAVFLALGLPKERRLNLPGEEASGVISGLKFLQMVNEGRSSAGGRRAVVIGGGDVAIDAARCAVRLGYENVTLVSLESREELPAIAEAVAEALEEGLVMMNGAKAIRIITEGGSVKGAEFARGRLLGFGPDGQPVMKFLPSSQFYLKADALIIAVGQAPDLSFLPKELERTQKGIVIDEWGRTNLPEVFAGGDVAGDRGSVVAAIASGKRAALAIDAHLGGNALSHSWAQIKIGQNGAISFGSYIQGLREEDSLDLGQVVKLAEINLDYFEKEPRREPGKISPAERTGNFSEVGLGLAPKEAAAEADRCFNCGICTACDNCLIFCPDVAVKKEKEPYLYSIDYDYCKGCGICVEECPRYALSSIQEPK